MKLHEHFLPTDLEKASKEFSCFKDCLEVVTQNIDEGNIEKAKHYSTDMLRSLQELSKLADRKKSFDRHKHLFQGMPTVTHIEISRMIK